MLSLFPSILPLHYPFSSILQTCYFFPLYFINTFTFSFCHCLPHFFFPFHIVFFLHFTGMLLFCNICTLYLPRFYLFYCHLPLLSFYHHYFAHSAFVFIIIINLIYPSHPFIIIIILFYYNFASHHYHPSYLS